MTQRLPKRSVMEKDIKIEVEPASTTMRPLNQCGTAIYLTRRVWQTKVSDCDAMIFARSGIGTFPSLARTREFAAGRGRWTAGETAPARPLHRRYYR
jgi:hypothetical protein